MMVFSEVLVAVIATAFPPTVAWLAHRLSPEGRLASRIMRLGSVHAAVPDSPERRELEEHLTAQLAKLNVRLRHDSVVLRRWKWGVGGALYAAFVAAIIIGGSRLSLESHLIVALLAGFAISVAVVATELVVVRRLESA